MVGAAKGCKGPGMRFAAGAHFWRYAASNQSSNNGIMNEVAGLEGRMGAGRQGEANPMHETLPRRILIAGKLQKLRRRAT